MRNPFRFAFNLKVLIPAVSLAVIVVIVMPIVAPLIGREKLFMVDRAYAQSVFEVTAVESDATGVEAKTPFRVKSKVAIEESELKDKLKFEPEMKFELKKISDTEYEVTSEKALEPGTVYNLVIEAAYQDEKGITIPKEFRFAFQVKDTFKISTTIPGNKADNVPTNSTVEVTFSHPTVTVEDFNKYFSIEPFVKGRFEKQGKAMVFVPKDWFRNETLYKVKITKGLPLDGTEQVLAEDYSFEFFTVKEPSVLERAYFSFEYNENYRSFSVDEKPVISIYYNEKDTNIQDLSVNLYRLKTFEDLQRRTKNSADLPNWVCFDCVNRDVDIKGLEPVFKSSFADVDAGNGSDKRLGLPAMNEKGFYAVDVLYKNERLAQNVFQVSDLKSYVISSETKTMVWVQNAKANKPEVGADVSLIEGKVSAKTNGNGIGIFDTPKCDSNSKYSDSDFVRVKSGENESVIFLMSSCSTADFVNGNYYVYNDFANYWNTLSTDRPVYLPIDSMNFWGVAKRRTNPGAQKLKVELRNYGYDKPVAAAEVTTSEFGTFEGKLELKNVPTTYYDLVVKDQDGKIIVARGVEVMTFKKPLYKFSVKADKDAVYVGEKVKVSAKVAFFDGTPATGIALKPQGSFVDKEETLYTDKNGEVEKVLDTSLAAEACKDETRDDDCHTYRNSWFSFSPVKAEYGFSSGEVSFAVLSSDMEVRLNRDYKAKTPLYTGSVVELDPALYGKSDFGKKTVPNHNVDIKIVKTWREKIENGESYDPITKLVSKNYRYENREQEMKAYSLTTDAKGEFKIDYPFDKDSTFYIKALILDSKGRKAVDRINYYDYPYYGDVNGEENRKQLTVNDPKAESDWENWHGYSIGDEAQLEVRVNDKPWAEKGDILFYTTQNGIREVKVGTQPTYGFVFSEKDVPGISVGAVWFDGKVFHGAGYSGAMASFKSEDRKLDVKIATDLATYKPGQTANITVTTLDKNGKPVIAAVNIKLVDEAIYAIRETYENILGDIYSLLPGGVITTASTSFESRADDGKGGGGGAEGEGGAYIRKDFKNTAYFGSARTGADGKATVQIKLPDDLTTFRITVQAITLDLQAGMATEKLVTAQPFFADVTNNDVYLTSDKPQIRLRAFGTELKEGADVDYSISIPSLGEKGKQMKVKVEKNNAGEYWYALPALTAGAHEMVVKAVSGSFKDAISKKINVVDSLVTVPVTRTRTLAEGTSLADLKAPRAKLVFSLSQYGSYYEQLQNLRWAYTGRLDAQIAAAAAEDLLIKNFGEEKSKNGDKDWTYYQNGLKGGLMLLPYGDANLDLSYRAVLLGADKFNVIKLEKYFEGIINNKKYNRGEIVMALAGEAALKLPVLNDMKMFMSYQKDLNLNEKLILAYGLAALGDNGVAGNLLDEVLSDREKIEGNEITLEISKDAQDNAEATALAGMVAAMTSHSKAQGLWNAVINSKTTRTLTGIERAVMLKSFVSHLASIQEGSFSYTLNGVTSTESLKKSESKNIFVSGDDLKDINFSSINGPVAVTVYYDSSLASTNPQLTPALVISRSYAVNGDETKSFKEGDLVRVVLKTRQMKDRSSNGYEIIDTLPAGLVPMAQVDASGYYGDGYYMDVKSYASLRYPYWVEGQKVAFRYFGYAKDESEISYMARVVSKGVFTAEPVIIQDVSNPTRLNVSGKAEVTIK
ncbi:Ig-like domain-containing protein [Candidatus Peregrinibacteria bacterium]|nr:Ig-like domain-containing protein [Candidatus Peregrinibacteria bacterium]